MTSERTLLILRWAARVGSLLSIGMLLAFVFGEGVDTAALTLSEWVGLLFFPVGVIVGMIMAWRWEGMGSLVVLVSFTAFYVAQWLLTGALPSGPWFAVFCLPALLFALVWLFDNDEGEKPHPPALPI
ncbi:MAG: hypothetical protein R2873_25370 [Caldilineaceae bacterium]|nr:hypothetical protein [Caldilineaceae bacterium]